MLNVDDYLQIRLLHRDGVSAREIARRLGHGRDTVKKALVEATPRGYTRTRPVNCPKLGPFMAVIDQILADDRSAPMKQRHTAHSIFERLRDDHQYLGGYDQVRRYVSSHRKRERETHLMLDHPPGCRMECDFGHIQVDFPEGRRLVPVLIAVWSNSHYPFVIALPNERTESILHGTVCAFEFFGCVPAELWWDNPTTVATAILRSPRPATQFQLRGIGEPLPVRTDVLHAGPGTGEKRRRADGVRVAAPVRHAGAVREGC